MEKEEVWQHILDQMEQLISEPSFESWFKPTKAIELNEYCLTVEVESEFQRNWLYQRYWNQINKIKDTILPKEIEVVLVLKNKTKQVDNPGKWQSDKLIEMILELNNRVDHLENELKQLKKE